MFVDRQQELERLAGVWGSDRAEFLVVYGRRRVGKTALLRQFVADRPHLFWTATLTSDELLRRGFTSALWRIDRDTVSEPGFVYERWESAFEALAPLAEDRRVAVVIDEYPYLVDSQAGVSSVLQKVWDQRLQHTMIKLVLCGSSIGMMEREALAYRAPLYGRRTGQIRLGPLPLHAAAEMLPRYDVTDQVTAYAAVGGIPAYLQLLDDRVALIENLERHVLDPDGYLHLEPEFLLREELREPRNYFGLLQAIAGGRTRVNEIAQAAGLERTAVSRYLATLRELEFVERRVPITETQPAKSRKGTYRVRDPFLRFWFRFVGPRRSQLASGTTAAVAHEVEAQLPQFVGPTFEDLCRDWIVSRPALDARPLTVERIGSWWDGQHELDIVALGEDAILVAECKWTARPVGRSVLDALETAASSLLRQYPDRKPIYGLFARAGFTPELEEMATAERLWLVDAERLLERPSH